MKLIQGFLHKDADGKWNAILDLASNEHYSIFEYKSQGKVVERANLVASTLGCKVETWHKMGEDGSHE